VDVTLVLSWALVVAAVAGYVAFVVRRLRARRAANDERTAVASGADSVEERLARTIATAARLTGEPPKFDVTDPPATVSAPVAPPPSTPTAGDAVDLSSLPPPVPPQTAPPPMHTVTVADVLRGIELPNDLAPLTTMAPRVGAADRVAFWTNTSVPAVVAPAFLDALRAIGCEIAPLGADTFAVERDGAHAFINVYADGRAAVIDGKPAYPSVPENAFVVEVWTSG
jgi:hypothetical protein